MNQPCLPVPRRRKRNHGTSNTTTAVSFDNIESMDAMEYLAAVIQQANSMPEFFTAASGGQVVPLSERTTDSMQGQVSLKELHLPCSNVCGWVDGTLANFSNLRLYLDQCRQEGVGSKTSLCRVQVPLMKDRSGWHIFCLGYDEARGNEGSYFDNNNEDEDVDDDEDNDPTSGVDASDSKHQESWRDHVPPQGHDPSVDLVLQMDQVMVRRVLAHLSHYAQQGWSISVQRTAWLYALLSSLERPIHRDDAATLFALLKHVTHLRNEVLHPDKNRDELARYNVLICIVGLYFEQGGGFDNLFTLRSTTSSNRDNGQ